VYVDERVRPIPAPSTSFAFGGKNYFFSYSDGPYYRPTYYRPATRIVFFDNSRGHDRGYHRGWDHHDSHHHR
jgi:hypothetical protein